MKKILCLILCIVLASFTLVACSSDEDIGGGIHDYPKGEQPEELITINMCIITGDSTVKSASDSVATKISDHMKRNYNTYLNITYVTESEYSNYIAGILGKKDASAPNIVFINSEETFKLLYDSKKLADLTDYYYSADYEKEFGILKQLITCKPLLERSKVGEKLYTVPNNRVVGEYSYLVVDKEVAVQKLHFANSDIATYKSIDDAEELMSEMTMAGYNAKDLVRVVNGPYELRYELSVGNICNVIEVPTVTAADAFASAFAVIKNSDEEYNYRAMRVIYAINTDVELRNYLQYGVFGANYNETDDGDIVRIKDSENTYDMNLIYTGNVLYAAFCSELGWTQEAKNYGELQIGDSVVD